MADEDVRIVGAVSLRVAFRTLSITRVGVSRLLEAGEQGGVEEGDGIGSCAECEMEFLFGLEGRSVPDEAGVEVGKDTQNTLLDLGIDLFPGELLFRDGDVEFQPGDSDWKSHLWELISLSGMERDLVGFEGFESSRGDSDLEDSWRQTSEGEGAKAVCYFDVLRVASLSFKRDSSVRNDAFIDVKYSSTDTCSGLEGQRLWKG